MKFGKKKACRDFFLSENLKNKIYSKLFSDWRDEIEIGEGNLWIFQQFQFWFQLVIIDWIYSCCREVQTWKYRKRLQLLPKLWALKTCFEDKSFSRALQFQKLYKLWDWVVNKSSSLKNTNFLEVKAFFKLKASVQSSTILFQIRSSRSFKTCTDRQHQEEFFKTKTFSIAQSQLHLNELIRNKRNYKSSSFHEQQTFLFVLSSQKMIDGEKNVGEEWENEKKNLHQIFKESQKVSTK